MDSISEKQVDFIEIINSGVNMLLSDQMEDARCLFAQDHLLPDFTPSKKRPSLSQQAGIFTRDHFVCRYCGKRTFFVPVLRAISLIVPETFPYHPNWKMSDCHIAYWRYGASIDHIIPIARGGNPISNDNLLTSCYMCNSVKQNWLVDELGWQLLPVSSEDWDGLSSKLHDLFVIARPGNKTYFTGWLHALAHPKLP